MLVTAQNFSKIVGVTGGKRQGVMGKRFKEKEQIMILTLENDDDDDHAVDGMEAKKKHQLES